MSSHKEYYKDRVSGSRPKKRRRRRRRGLPWWGAALVVLLALLLLGAGSVAVYVKSKLNKIQYDEPRTAPVTVTESITAPAPEEMLSAGAEDEVLFAEEGELVDISALEPTEDVTVPLGEIYADKNVYNILLLGTDYPYNQNDPGRADSIMILSLDFRDNSARLVSIERGIGAPILSGQYKGQWDWITHLYHYGGADMMLETVRYCFKLDVERYAQVDFDAFVNVVNALGGIDIRLSEAEAARLNLAVGWNHLGGQDALGYARLRSIDSDWVRITRQRQVIQACMDRLKGADLATLNRTADAVLPYIHTNLSQREILSLMTKAPGFLGVQFEQMTIPAQGTYGGMGVMGGRGAFAPDFEVNTRLLREFLYGTV